MAINEHHPDCPAYREKWEILTKNYLDQEEELEIRSQQEEIPFIRRKKRDLLREYSVELKKLQNEYAHLFTHE